MEYTCETQQEYYRRLVHNMHRISITKYGGMHYTPCPSIMYMAAYICYLQGMSIGHELLEEIGDMVYHRSLYEIKDMSYLDGLWYRLTLNVSMKAMTTLMYILNTIGKRNAILNNYNM